MSRLSLLVWVAAPTAAAYPTWIAWQPEDAESQSYMCVGDFWDLERISPFLTLRGDLGTLTELVVTWGIPVLVVLAALGHWRSAAAGRRAAGFLVLIAIVRPLTPWYSEDEPCGGLLDLFSPDWFEAVLGSWGPVEYALLISAALVLLATHASGPAQEPAGTPIRRAGLVFLIDYLIVAYLVTLAVVLTDGWASSMHSGLLNWLSFDAMLGEPARLLTYPALIGYILLRRRLAARPAVVASLPPRSAVPRWVSLIWTAALAAAAFPTWQSWPPVPSEWARHVSGSGVLRSFLETLRDDAGRVVEFAITWGVPAVAVLACVCLRGPAPVGRRVAGMLAAIAVARQLLTTFRFDTDLCCSTPGIKDLGALYVNGDLAQDVHGEPLQDVGVQVPGGWLAASLLVAAVLVLVASRWMAPAVGPVRARSSRRVAALLIDYAVVVAILLTLLKLGVTDVRPLDHGLLDPAWQQMIFEEVEWLLVVLSVFLYALSGHTVGKLIMRVRIVTAGTGRRPAWGRLAVRALIFPLLAFTPQIGIALLVLDGLWATIDPSGRSLHDRLSGTIVVDKPA
ncbi:RDD family protein [Nonomuraea sp. WAC 01424]|uniref:RDD family protein n=1 Tax=Nonomuraea sp. WAC 01424 TaxID=2203200 RepID=UPI000F7855BC|nr:RDD family protein [Nonomuraea sp. WAC 01424]